MTYLLELSYCLLYVIGITFLILKFNEYQYKRKLVWIASCVAVYTLFNYILTDISIYINLEFIARNLLVIIFDFIYVTILLRKMNGTNFIVSILYFLLYGSFLVIFINLFTQVFGIEISKLTNPGMLKSEIVILVICSTTLIMYLLSSFLSAIKVDMKIKETFPFLVLNGFNIFIIMLFLINFENPNSIQMLLFVFLLIILQTLILNFMFIKAIKKYDRENEEKLIDLSNQYNMNLLEDLKKEQESYHKLKHDIENHLLILETLAATQDIKSYVNEIKNDVITNRIKVETGNLFVDACLNSKISTYENVQIIINAILCNDIHLCDKDICSLLFNILDNAVNAAKESSKREVELKMIQNESSLSIRCKNSCDDEPNFISNSGNGHGYGLKIIDHIVKTYNGEILKEYANNEFVVSVYFCFNET
ncbi:sensor histidine kinase [Amedibacillus sp. YH-ame6]